MSLMGENRYFWPSNLCYYTYNICSFCEEFGMKLAQIEDQETLDAIGLQLAAIQNQGVSLTEVATGERSSVNLDKDIYPEDFNAAGELLYIYYVTLKPGKSVFYILWIYKRTFLFLMLYLAKY